ncbi:MAG: hypothetical protein ACHBN1_26965 [Heteroscytonema crispum UTEX LB 1556]
MNKFAKALIIALVFAAPAAIASSAAQAKTAPVVTQRIASAKTDKTHHQKHQMRHQKVAHSKRHSHIAKAQVTHSAAAKPVTSHS